MRAFLANELKASGLGLGVATDQVATLQGAPDCDRRVADGLRSWLGRLGVGFALGSKLGNVGALARNRWDWPWEPRRQLRHQGASLEHGLASALLAARSWRWKRKEVQGWLGSARNGSQKPKALELPSNTVGPR